MAFRTWTDRISRKPEAIVVSLFDELQKWASQRHFFAWDSRVSQSNWPKCLATPHEQSRAGTAANKNEKARLGTCEVLQTQDTR